MNITFSPNVSLGIMICGSHSGLADEMLVARISIAGALSREEHVSQQGTQADESSGHRHQCGNSAGKEKSLRVDDLQLGCEALIRIC